MRKRIIIIVVLLLWGAVIFAAYRYFSTILKQKAIAIDNERLYDISVNDYYIAKFYTDKNRLPDNLTEIVQAEKNDPDRGNLEPFALKDPETKKEYAYKPVSDSAYQICTTFATDTVKDRTLFDDYTAYVTADLEQFAKSVYHKSGYDCMELSMEGNPDVARVKEIDPTKPLEAFNFVTPQKGDRVCLDSEYTLAWNGDPSTENVGIYLVPPSNINQPQSWLKNGYEISPGELVPNETADITKLVGSFKWKVGNLEAYATNAAPQSVLPGTGYQLGVVTTNGGQQHRYSSNYFEIANCNTASTQLPNLPTIQVNTL